MAQDFVQCWLDAIESLEAAERDKIIKLLQEIENGTSNSNSLLTALCQAEKQLLSKIGYLNQIINDAADAIVKLNNAISSGYCPEVKTLITVINGASSIAALDMLDAQRSLTGLQMTMASLNGKVTIGDSLGKQAAQYRAMMQTLP